MLALGLVLYLGGLAHNDTQPVQVPWHQDLADWLVAHHLTFGLAGGGEANITTLDSDGKVRLAPLTAGGASAHAYESDYSWYNPAVSRANFIVSVTWPPGDVADVKPNVIRAKFGPPARTYHFKEYTITVYDYNLLTRLDIPTLGGFKTP